MLYYKEGSSLQQEIKGLYDLFKSGDVATVTCLVPLFVKSLETTSPVDSETTPLVDSKSTLPANTETPALETSTLRQKKRKAKTPHKPFKTPPFVHFQQTIIREKLKTMSDEEAEAVEDHVERSYAVAMTAWECPWLSPSDSAKAESKLKAEYHQK